jgi:hypothetical protein
MHTQVPYIWCQFTSLGNYKFQGMKLSQIELEINLQTEDEHSACQHHFFFSENVSEHHFSKQLK